MNTVFFRTLNDSYEKVSLYKIFPNLSLDVLANVCDEVIDDVPLITLPVHPTLELSTEFCDTILTTIFNEDMLLGYWDCILCLKQKKVLEDELATGKYGYDNDDDFKLLNLLNILVYCSMNQTGLIWS